MGVGLANRVVTSWALILTAALLLQCKSTKPAPLPPSEPAAATEWMPLAVGNVWTLGEGANLVEMRVADRHMYGTGGFRGLCFVLEWTSDGSTVERKEYWTTDEEGIWVVSREAGGQIFHVAKPWQFLKSPLGVGDQWQADERLALQREVSESWKIAATSEEEVATPSGTYQALRVEFRGSDEVVTRWFARGVGIVREDTAGSGNFGSRFLSKVAVRKPAAARAPAGQGQAPKDALTERVQRAFAAQRPEYAKACAAKGFNGPLFVGASVEVTLTFDAGGVETGRAFGMGIGGAEIMKCVKELTVAGLRIDPPGKTTSITVKLSLP